MKKENNVMDILPDYYRNLEFKLKNGKKIKGHFEPEFELGDGGPWFCDNNADPCYLFSIDEVVSWRYI